MIQIWARTEESCGVEALRHKNQNKVWTAEEKYELVAKVLAGESNRTTAIAAGIDKGLLYSWVRCYKMKGYQGLVAQRQGRPPKEPDMRKKIEPTELTPSEREEMIRLRAENERLRAEIAVVKKEIALREERCAAQLKAKRLRSSKNSTKKDTDWMICWMPLGCPGRHIIMSSAEPTKSKNETPIYRLKLFPFSTRTGSDMA